MNPIVFAALLQFVAHRQQAVNPRHAHVVDAQHAVSKKLERHHGLLRHGQV